MEQAKAGGLGARGNEIRVGDEDSSGRAVEQNLKEGGADVGARKEVRGVRKVGKQGM